LLDKFLVRVALPNQYLAPASGLAVPVLALGGGGVARGGATNAGAGYGRAIGGCAVLVLPCSEV